MPVKLKKDNHDHCLDVHYKGSLHKASVSNMSKKPSNMPERTNKPKRTNKIKVKNDSIIAEATLNPKEDKKSEKNTLISLIAVEVGIIVEGVQKLQTKRGGWNKPEESDILPCPAL